MSELLKPELIKEISLETGIAPAFIEKDWFAVQLIKIIEDYNNSSLIKSIFSGGTSLSKGHKIIKRFSEDLDFFLSAPNGEEPSQGQRRSFRKDLLEHIASSNEHFKIDDGDVERGDSYRFFKAPIAYLKSFEQETLRPHLQLEMTFSEPRLDPIECSISSMVSSFLQKDPETKINCISPIETAADKLSALTWRIIVRERGSEKDDPTIIRHLHDLASLQPVINSDTKNFIAIANSSLERDRNRRGGELIQGLSNAERIAKTLDLLKTDRLYRREYESFVLSMSYANEDEIILFDSAISKLEYVCKLYLQ